jgi:hypothetical protein
MTILSAGHKVVGYFSYTKEGNVFCEGDACIIAGSEELMNLYKKQMLSGYSGRDIVRKTKFGEIIRGLEQGGAYAFDREAYSKFYSLAQRLNLNNFPKPDDFFSDLSVTGLHFIRIQLSG